MFGKLHMHTETTLFNFQNSTTCLGQTLQRFSQECCVEFTTYDLPHETAARAWRRATQDTKETVKTMDNMPASCKPHVFNMSTYKLHTLGDYVKSIWQYGTMDNYSMQVASGALWINHLVLNRNLGRAGTSLCQMLLFKDQQDWFHTSNCQASTTWAAPP